MQDFQPFTISVLITSIEQLQGLWLIANSNRTTENFLNDHPQSSMYGLGPFNGNPLGKEWSELHTELQKYITFK